ncbi:hypothetical protein H0H93_011930, partial [Arthromyces matolae]
LPQPELLPSIQKLSIAGYNLFATSDTADFLTKHNVPFKYLEMLSEDSHNEKSEYSLIQHLANNLIDMSINLLPRITIDAPQSSYSSNGYRTRHMAFDVAVPLITNVKECEDARNATSS